ncbi:hypothetical protein QE372_004804 [Agrobacterium pusense]|nr:hypothetical protein [Agrobacterium pusense]
MTAVWETLGVARSNIAERVRQVLPEPEGDRRSLIWN